MAGTEQAAAYDAAHASDALDTLGAIALALEAGTDDASRLKLVERLVENGPRCGPEAVNPTRMLVGVIRELNAKVAVG